MRRSLLTACFIALGFVAGSLSSSMLRLSADAQQPKKPTYLENPIGSVPTDWGELVNSTGAPGAVVLTFKNEKGQIRMVEFRGNKLNDRVFLVDRAY